MVLKKILFKLLHFSDIKSKQLSGFIEMLHLNIYLLHHIVDLEMLNIYSEKIYSWKNNFWQFYVSSERLLSEILGDVLSINVEI